MSTQGTTSISTSSDLIHNRNCYAYLFQLRPFINDDILKILPVFEALIKIIEQYDEHFPYGNLYTYCISYLENQIDILYPKLSSQQAAILDDLIYAIYHNDNHILENADWLNEIGAKTRPLKVNMGKKIALQLADRNRLINKTSPHLAGNPFNLFITLIGPDFKPQYNTNLPSIKNFSYKEKSAPKELRFGTQAQRHQGIVRTSPLFVHWLKIHAQKHPPSQKITHVYFNNLSLDRNDPFDIPGINEKKASLDLHKQEENPQLKLAVITLPANESLMGAHHYKITDNKLGYKDVFSELLTVADKEYHYSGITDFRISPKIRTLLFLNATNQTAVLRDLLENSFATMGIAKGESLSSAQKQAVWLHFTKFELTNYIITTLTPANSSLSYNFSCKDAIDRGALSSIYYNLIKSFKLNRPMQRLEFERAIDIAAANVKGRGMNFHRNVLWNSLNTYVNANYEMLIEDTKKSWLIYWRDMNCPHSQVTEVLKKRIKQCSIQLNRLLSNQASARKKGLALLASIDKQKKLKVTGKRLLLEVVSRSSKLLVTTPDADMIESCLNLAKELKINYPLLHMIVGLLEAFTGALLYLPSFGHSKPLIANGKGTFKNGFFAAERNKLCEQFTEYSLQYKSPSVAC